jgi:hypothetical protein
MDLRSAIQYDKASADQNHSMAKFNDARCLEDGVSSHAKAFIRRQSPREKETPEARMRRAAKRRCGGKKLTTPRRLNETLRIFAKSLQIANPREPSPS